MKKTSSQIADTVLEKISIDRNPPPGHPEHVIGDAADYVSKRELAKLRARLQKNPRDARVLGGFMGAIGGGLGGLGLATVAKGGAGARGLGTLGGAAAGGLLGRHIGSGIKTNPSDDDLMWELYTNKLMGQPGY
jgi:predicted lipid-binding transport protein (Tim44 family)